MRSIAVGFGIVCSIFPRLDMAMAAVSIFITGVGSTCTDNFQTSVAEVASHNNTPPLKYRLIACNHTVKWLHVCYADTTDYRLPPPLIKWDIASHLVLFCFECLRTPIFRGFLPNTRTLLPIILHHRLSHCSATFICLGRIDGNAPTNIRPPANMCAWWNTVFFKKYWIN